MAAEPQKPQPFQVYEQSQASRYDRWYESEKGRVIAAAEEELLARLLTELAPATTVLEVGCGTGHFSRWLSTLGLGVFGADVAPGMLGFAQTRGGGPRYITTHALALPFPDRAIDIAAFVTSLEFVPDPGLALAEAARVARRGVLLGVLSATSPLGVWRRAQSRFGDTPYRGARFYSPWGLARLARESIGPRVTGVTWRTGPWPGWYPSQLRALPFGAFIGMAIRLDAES